MAQGALLTKGIVYDTSRQVVTLHQVVERFMLGDSLCEKCIVTEIMFDEHAGYTYTLIGLKSLRNFRTHFIFDEHESASGFFADLAYPTFLAAEQVEEVIARAAAAEKQRREEAAIAQRRLHRGALVVDYSAKALAIFTDEPSDVSVLERIKAKRNSSLTYQGRKVAGWIFPKYRQAQLAAVMSL